LNCVLQFELVLSEDGSGRGAALVAAVADRLRSVLHVKQKYLSLQQNMLSKCIHRFKCISKSGYKEMWSKIIKVFLRE